MAQSLTRAVALAASLAFAAPAFAQTNSSSQTDSSSQANPPPATTDQPKTQDQSTAPAAQQPPLQVPGPTTTGSNASPNLAVATVKMENGTRASKIIAAAVFNDQNQQVGTVDDVILDHDNKAVLAIISVGGFLGVGGKLVAVAFTQLHMDDKGKVLLPDGSKDALNKMPGFVYGT